MLQRIRSKRARNLLQRLAAGEPPPENFEWKRLQNVADGYLLDENVNSRHLFETMAKNPHVPDEVRRRIIAGIAYEGSRYRRGVLEPEKISPEFDLEMVETALTSTLLETTSKFMYLERAWEEQKRRLHWGHPSNRLVMYREDRDRLADHLEAVAARQEDRTGRICISVLRRDDLWTDKMYNHGHLAEKLRQFPDNVLEVYWQLVDDNQQNDWETSWKYLLAAEKLT